MNQFLLNPTKKAGNKSFLSDGLVIACLFFITFLSNTILAQAGALDVTFAPGTGANGNVSGICQQPDGKILIGGSFSSYNGTGLGRVARLNTTGTIDATFVVGAGANNTTYGPILQPDGKIIIFGNFTTYKGVSRPRIARINTDGSLDVTFTPGTGANTWIYGAALQPDGKIIIVGNFTTYNGTAVPRIARLNANGTLDGTFTPGTGPDNYPYTVVLQPDGKILIAGSFNNYNGTARSKIARVNANGTIDLTFTPGTGAAPTAQLIYALALQSDGKIIIGGGFTSYNGTARARLARINANGTIDATFAPTTGANNVVYTASVASDGKIIIGGSFTTYNGTSSNRIACVNDDGTLNTAFKTGNGTGANGIIYATLLQSDRNILIGGALTTFNGTSRPRIARLNKACLNATLPVLSASSLTICSGQSATLSVSTGTLNDATNWQWHKVSCSGTAAGTGTSIIVSPTVTTIYYARGEGGCATPSSCSSITITVNPVPVATISSNTAICNGASTTSTVNATGGTGAITYNWMPGNLSGASQVLTPSSSPSIYTATATDANGCSASASQTITFLPMPVVSISSNTSVCNGSSTTSTVNATGGTGAITYNWMPGNLSGASQVLTPSSSPSIYTATATDANGCMASASQTITFYPMPVVSISPNTTICNGASTTSTVNATGGTGAITYNWMPGNLSGSSQVLTPPSNSTNVYTATATDANGCTGSANQTVTVASCAGSQLTAGSCGITETTLNQTLNFSAVSGATNYKLEIVCAAQSFSVVNVRGNNFTTFNMAWVSGIQYGRTYSIRISAYVGGAWQPYGNTCTVTTPPVVAIPTTQFSAGSCNITLSNLNQSLNFGLVSGATNYKFEIVCAAQSFSVVNIRNNTNSYFILGWISGIQYGRAYDIRISAYVNNAWQPYGSTCNITTPATIPTTQMSAGSCGITESSKSQTLNFDAVSGASNYKVEVVNATQPLNVVNVRNSTATTFNLAYVTGIQVGRTYDLRVAANVGGIWASYGPMCQVTVGGPKDGSDGSNNNLYSRQESLNSATEETEISVNIYPNPTNGELNIESSESIKSISVYNLTGELIAIEENTNQINLSQFANGLYVVHVKTENNTKLLKITKQ